MFVLHRSASPAVRPTLRPFVSTFPRAKPSRFAGLGVTGPGDGIDAIGRNNVVLSGVWVHDTGGFSGLYLASRSVVSVTDSLFEAIPSGAVLAFGSTVHLDRTVVRNTLAQPDQRYGVAIEVDETNGERGALT